MTSLSLLAGRTVCLLFFLLVTAPCLVNQRRRRSVWWVAVHQGCLSCTILGNYQMTKNRKLFATRNSRHGVECGTPHGGQVERDHSHRVCARALGKRHCLSKPRLTKRHYRLQISPAAYFCNMLPSFLCICPFCNHFGFQRLTRL